MKNESLNNSISLEEMPFDTAFRAVKEKLLAVNRMRDERQAAIEALTNDLTRAWLDKYLQNVHLIQRTFSEILYEALKLATPELLDSRAGKKVRSPLRFCDLKEMSKGDKLIDIEVETTQGTVWVTPLRINAHDVAEIKELAFNKLGLIIENLDSRAIMAAWKESWGELDNQLREFLQKEFIRSVDEKKDPSVQIHGGESLMVAFTA